MKSQNLVSLVFVLLVIEAFGAYIGYSTLAVNSNVTGGCASPISPAPRPVQTNVGNGTVEVTRWLQVFLMPENSTGTICVQYFGDYTGQVYTGIGTLNQNGTEYSQTLLVNVSASPSSISAGGYGSPQTVAYNVVSHAGSTGFYGLSIFQICSSVPFAVGYFDYELNGSDFSWAINIENNGCPAISLTSNIVGLTNIQVIYLPVLAFTESSSSTSTINSS